MEQSEYLYKEYREELTKEVEERFILARERMHSLVNETWDNPELEDYFHTTALFLLKIYEVLDLVSSGEYEVLPGDKKQEYNQELYFDILPGQYERSYGNPKYCRKQFGKELGEYLCFLCSELRSLIPDAYTQNVYDITIYTELFLEIWSVLKDEGDAVKGVQQALYWFEKDYSEVILEDKINHQFDPTLDFITSIVMKGDLSTPEYLYSFGEYVSENEIALVKYMNTLPGEKIHQIAETFVNGYIDGFQIMNVDLSKKKYVNIRYCLGFERLIKEAILQFEKHGLTCVVYMASSKNLWKNSRGKAGCFGTSPNKQYEYDHRFDDGIFLDKGICERKMEVYRCIFPKVKKLASLYGGPAVLEVFGENPFTPLKVEEAVSYTKEQQKLAVSFTTEYASLFQEYVPGEEVSFTIMALPIPEIGPKFQDIFQKTIEINTLDNDTWRKIQQSIIDVMDQGEYVHVLGKGENETDLYINLWKLKNKEKETKFENCVADVNIPLGEVFTSPVLLGTHGTLAVSKVYLNDLRYDGLKLTFKDGMVASYDCSNYSDNQENQTYIKENLLKHRDTLPMGEFAIGTNTPAYEMAAQFDILHRLPILIVEKMGPHFAIGDTCYSHSEETKVYNPDGKEIVAKENEVSRRRDENSSEAYFNCHTDITIPYDEIAQITVCGEDGDVTIIKDGRFVLPGTEYLNVPLQRMESR